MALSFKGWEPLQPIKQKGSVVKNPLICSLKTRLDLSIKTTHKVGFTFTHLFKKKQQTPTSLNMETTCKCKTHLGFLQSKQKKEKKTQKIFLVGWEQIAMGWLDGWTRIHRWWSSPISCDPQLNLALEKSISGCWAMNLGRRDTTQSCRCGNAKRAPSRRKLYHPPRFTVRETLGLRQSTASNGLDCWQLDITVRCSCDHLGFN